MKVRPFLLFGFCAGFKFLLREGVVKRKPLLKSIERSVIIYI